MIWENDNKMDCGKECFANIYGKCQALTEPYRGECPFRRTDITMEQQCKDMEGYYSKNSWQRLTN